MNRRDLFKSASALVAMGLLPQTVFAGANGPQAAVAGPRETLLLNKGWRFFDGDIPFPTIMGHGWTYNAAKAGSAQGAAATGYDDSEWTPVSLPHDFVSFQPIVEDANVSQGYRKRGIVWYRNTLRFEKADNGKHIELQLDGIATNATVWFNGTLVARNWSGYNSVYIDLTPYATYGDLVNSLVIRVDANAMEGWWYEGGGIYRDAWIVKRNPVHIVTDGVFAHPVPAPQSRADWKIPVEVTLNNSGTEATEVTVVSELWDDRVGLLATEKTQATVAPLGGAVARIDLLHNRPRLWSIDDPQLYTVRTYILKGDTRLDEITTTCGFRTQRFDVDKGFFLNDKHLKIQGVCIHQDHAGVGVAVPDGVIDFRLRRLKELGCNAIRFSHNAQSRALMDACDRHGFLVMAENRVFNPAPIHMAELQWLVRRDRNHPSVYLWSVFNEEPMQGTEAGYQMVRRMSEAVKELDTSRPVTAAMNDGLFTPLNVAHAVDVVGINYQQDQYDAFHKAHPTIPVFSSEDTSAFMTRGVYKTDKDKRVSASYDDDAADWGATHRKAWKAIATRDYIAGGFVWTGFDYHGEPTPYIWPSNSSVFGIMDLCGFEKAAFWIHQAQWVKDRPVLGLVPHWNWETAGQPVRVMACSNQEEVELFVNGKSAGRQKVDPYEMNFWTVPYAPGAIEVRGYTGGKLVRTTRNETAGEPVALRLNADRAGLKADGRDAQPLTVEAIDKKGRHVPLAQHMITYEISGGAIIGLGNGDANSLEPEKGDKRSLYNGYGQVIVQSLEGQAGTLRIRATTPGLKAADLRLPVEATAPLAYQVTTPSVQLLDSWFIAPMSVTRPDPGQKAADNDMNSWQWFRPGTLNRPLDQDGYSLVAVRYTPYAKVQKVGGKVEFLGITGTCEVYENGKLIGTKADAAPGALTLDLQTQSGERRLSVLFKVRAGEAYGFNRQIRTRSKD
ncbi:Beta-galactosidase BoGH2A [Asticcacaulis sp. MM231]|uniref:beta-galactosidase GalA n=1 Tax=Asticcacaulis sp. MM231 TaxID=3157666 RepID=UPI0032D5735D